MKPTVVLVVGLLAVVVTGPVAAATGPSNPETPPEADEPTPTWPDDETVVANNTTVSPGQQLAGAVGTQGASVEGELWNRTLSDRLENATTRAERAEVLAEEIAAVELYVEALEGVRANVTVAWDEGELSEGEYRASVSELVVRARVVEMRANRTIGAAEELSPGMRATYDVNVTHARTLENRSVDLYRFEDEVGRDAANETLDNESAESETPWAGDRERR
ncbi:hypothetical protein NGM10_13285 [Halorussus salilacus]|uniref:DUF7096 domain-containing protein n=1 Tax=Halorussus salilacus TaxID=2953750 RepID=UPI00209FD460|nr:hypothetical protein [Halorussus salilacus]USZ67695.1 hypothetical protein NGM10_13285 [Halorussus salilacus]